MISKHPLMAWPQAGFITLFLIASNLSADTLIIGKVIGITDGDTITVLVNQKSFKIRLAQIDAPEKRQPYGEKAKQNLAKLVFGKVVSLEVTDTDRYGRSVANLTLNGYSINREMVRSGYAWAYRKYLRDQSLLEDEKNAKIDKVGIWSLPANLQIPPWEWRSSGFAHKQHHKLHPKVTIEIADDNLATLCGSVKTCKDMSSCEEARAALSFCHQTNLDRDKDGVPCESICQ